MDCTIVGTIINATYPRSGHRLLRTILMNYFMENMVFYEPYEERVISKDKTNRTLKDANYIKTHDFMLEGKKVLIDQFPHNRRYLVQIRHPLEAIASYYEFSVRNNHIVNDNEDEWRKFLNNKLEYWMRFVDQWVINVDSNALVVDYHSLVTNMRKILVDVISYITGGLKTDDEKLDAAMENASFLRYANDSKSKRMQIRNICNFRYYDEALFHGIEKALFDSHINVIGIKKIFA